MKWDFSNKKAQVFGMEVAWVFIVLIVVGLGLIYGLSAFSELNDDIQSDLDLSAEAKQASTEAVGNSPTYMDGVFFFLFIMLWVFVIAAAYFSSTNPAFMVITLIVVVIGLIAVMFLANAFEEMVDDSEVETFADEFPKTNWILEHSALLMVFVGFSFLLVLYSRRGL